MVQDARLAHLDMSSRTLRSIASKVIIFPNMHTKIANEEHSALSPIKEMLQLRYVGTFSFEALPTFLAEDNSISSVARKFGAVARPSASMLVEVATALANHRTTLYPRFARPTATAGSHDSSYRDVINWVSNNIGKCILYFSEREHSLLPIVEQVEDIAFVVPLAGPGRNSDRSELLSPEDPPYVVAQNQAVRYEYMRCSWLVRPVMPKHLSNLCVTMEPPVDVVVRQLMLFVSDRKCCLEPAPFKRHHN